MLRPSCARPTRRPGLREIESSEPLVFAFLWTPLRLSSAAFNGALRTSSAGKGLS